MYFEGQKSNGNWRNMTRIKFYKCTHAVQCFAKNLNMTMYWERYNKNKYIDGYQRDIKGRIQIVQG